ncbi:uncharacterized protein LOC126334791 isoform X1 [Schistocerca gregaria]|uniref:uncharacterized protein LOC126334791 isoform X1 n=1 Tax=Schistocerca gregaria TaxID=7010 RepID=UPI00211DC070|nr:uncharacterized protein LOC126334791 isoform X1 [Schistocerca gregaria]
MSVLSTDGETSIKTRNVERRLSASKVKKLLPKELYNRVAAILLLSTSSDYLIDGQSSYCESGEHSFDQTSLISGSNVLSRKHTKETNSLVGGEREFPTQELPHGVATDLHMHPPSIRSKCVTANASTSRTPQFKFMQYAELEAAWWRLDTTKRDISQLPLEQRAKIITSQIIADFVQWQKNFLASEIPILSENVLAELFEVDFDKPIAHALCIHLREIPYVTPMVAKENAMPEFGGGEGG